MLEKKRNLILILLLVSILFLTSCSTATPVEKINKDIDTYYLQNVTVKGRLFKYPLMNNIFIEGGANFNKLFRHGESKDYVYVSHSKDLPNSDLSDYDYYIVSGEVKRVELCDCLLNNNTDHYNESEYFSSIMEYYNPKVCERLSINDKDYRITKVRRCGNYTPIYYIDAKEYKKMPFWMW